MPEAEPAARCIDVVKTYRPRSGPVHAIRGLTVGFPRRAMTAVAGPSGSGKSSLLRILAGLDRPTSGSVIVGGVDLGTASHGASRLARRRTIRYVFQRPSDNFFPQLTVDEHLALASRHAAVDTGFTPESALEELGIAPHSGRRVEELSGGEQQRAAFAQALVAGAPIVIADEPTAELDATSAVRLIGSVRRLVELGVTLIVATHDTALIRAADGLIELEDGRRRRRLPASPQDRELRTHSTHPSPPVVGIGAARQSGPVVLEARDLRKAYRKGPERIVAVRDATFRMHERELVGLLGRSGSGKTTLLNVVAGWEPPDAGEISRPGGTGDPPAWDEISVVPQRLGLMEELTVRENVEYPARLSGALPELRGFVDGLMTDLGLEELRDRYPGETSVGQQQRAALARALVLSPRLLLADEPSGHQDRAWTGRVFEALRRAGDRGTACLTATHDEGVAPLLDRVLSMVDGLLEERTA